MLLCNMCEYSKTFKHNSCIYKIYEPCSVKRGLHEFVKHIDPRQPALTAQADMGQNYLVPLNFLNVWG